MNEKDVLKKLKLLKTISPRRTTLVAMQKNVYRRVGTEDKTFIGKIREFTSQISMLVAWQQIVVYSAVAACIALLFIGMAALVLPGQTQSMLLSAKLAIASNQYEKARIALADTTSRFGGYTTNMSDFSQSLTTTNAALNALHLKGESGKYTAEQCHTIYQEYRAFLEKKEKDAPENSALSAQIHSYEELAEKKLHMYSPM